MPIVKSLRRTPAFPAFTPFTFAEDLTNRVRQLLDENFELPGISEPIGFLPATQIIETPEELLVTTELPGMAKKDVELTIDEGILTIKGEKVEEKKEGEEKRKYHLWERTYGSFERVFRLPVYVDATKITADMDNGVLKVHLPKTTEAKAKGRKIEIAEAK